MLHDDLALVTREDHHWVSCSRRPAGEPPVSADGESEIKDGMLDASLIKTIPMLFDDSADCRFDVEGNHAKMLFRFREVALAIPEIDVNARVGEGNRRVTDRFAVAFKNKYQYSLVNVVFAVHWNVAVRQVWTATAWLGGTSMTRSRAEGRVGGTDTRGQGTAAVIERTGDVKMEEEDDDARG